jgi:hypothetical protein
MNNVIENENSQLNFGFIADELSSEQTKKTSSSTSLDKKFEHSEGFFHIHDYFEFHTMFK